MTIPEEGTNYSRVPSPGQQVRIKGDKPRSGQIGTNVSYGPEKTMIGDCWRIEFEDGTGAGLYKLDDFDLL